MSSNLLCPPPLEQRHSENFPSDVPYPKLQLHFDSLLRFAYFLTSFLQFLSIQYRYKGNCSAWRYLGESPFRVQRTNLYITHIHTHIYHKLLLLYRYEISTLDVSNFFFLLQTVLRIRGNSFLVPWQASFHSRIPVSCFCPSFYW